MKNAAFTVISLEPNPKSLLCEESEFNFLNLWESLENGWNLHS